MAHLTRPPDPPPFADKTDLPKKIRPEPQAIETPFIPLWPDTDQRNICAGLGDRGRVPRRQIREKGELHRPRPNWDNSHEFCNIKAVKQPPKSP
jgi:hypothetical protein